MASRVAARLDLPVWVVVGLGLSLSLIAAATLSPAANRIAGSCLRSMVAPVDPRDLIGRSDRVLNTWLFVPLGFFAGFLAVRRVWVLVLAFCVPLFVEGIQRYAQVLGRRCQFQDLVDNTWGLILGALVGVVVGLVAQRTGSVRRS
ncbi:MAG: VanZ family protein [Actinobacteria bacterium]|nr:VanZ family protein [Actinomycetota bacterium]MCO5299043.1 VanZ family protein [Candidatus Nanopelagicales bacterium]MCB9427214.1 VanZ family protein [Actinomycetota bacterium]HPE11522.1 VanZ family protein [Actinomycetota bacterium]HPQ83150.1 VanZ family protein [Actinomycetota bacterium]